MARPGAALAAGLMIGVIHAAASAQPAERDAARPAAAPADDEGDGEEIVVQGQAPRGSVIGNVKPEQTLTPADVRSYGVNSVTDLIAEIAPQTGGRDAQPVVLLNGKRISGFSEIADIPTEAISRVEVLPEEVALSYGYAANQKVVNVVLRQRFRSWTGEVRGGTTTKGGRENGQGNLTLLRIRGDSRTNLSVEYQAADDLRESERGISPTAPRAPFSLAGTVTPVPGSGASEIDPRLSVLAGTTVARAAAPAGASAAPLTLADFVAGANSTSISDIGRYRTLSPATESLKLNGVMARTLPFGISGTLNGRLEFTDSDSLQGLPSAALLLPAGNPFSPFANDVELYRYLAAYGPLAQSVSGANAHLGLGLNGSLKTWRWSFNGAFDHNVTRTSTDRGIDASPLQALLDARSPGYDPFGTPPYTLSLDRLIDTGRARSSALNGDLLVSGSPFSLPAGKATMTIRVGATHNGFASRSVRVGVLRSADFSRDFASGQASLDVPIASRRSGVLQGLGDLSLNATVAAQHYSDFGTLTTLGYGLRWTPVPAIRLIASVTQDRSAPSGQQINDPLVVTPNFPVFDYAAGRTVFVSQISGGNSGLAASDRRTFRLSATVKPISNPDLTITANYTNSRTDNPIANLPAPTPQIEAAFRSRFVRDAAGQLVSVDARAVNFDEQRTSQLRWGVNLSVPIKSGIQKAFEAWRAAGSNRDQAPPEIKALLEQRQRFEAMRQARGAGAQESTPSPAPGAPGADGPRAGGFRGGGFGGRGGGGGAQGRLQFGLYHTWRFTNEIAVGPSVPVIDLLNGGAIGNGGGQPRHELELQAGYTNNGLGARLSGSWQSPTRVDGALGSAGSTLRFGSLATFNLRLFANLGQRLDLVRAHPFLRGTRVSLSVNNVFDQHQTVRDASGATPLRYQPGYLDPLGRTITVSFRKQIF